MFGALRTYRRWHRLVNISQKRFAITSAIAASAVPALVLAHGHKINKVPEFPLVVSDDVEEIKKTKEAVAVLKAVHALTDVKHSADSRKLRAGKGKMRNRRYVQRRGVLVIHDKNEGLGRAFRNISGVDIANVNRLNLLHLAPGGYVGRFIIWTEGAFKKLDQLYGTRFRTAQLKKGYKHPTAEMHTTDLSRIIHSPEIQSHVRRTNLLRKVTHVPKVRKDLLLTRKVQKYNKPVTKSAKARAEKRKKAQEEEKAKKPAKKPASLKAKKKAALEAKIAKLPEAEKKKYEEAKAKAAAVTEKIRARRAKKKEAEKARKAAETAKNAAGKIANVEKKKKVEAEKLKAAAAKAKADQRKAALAAAKEKVKAKAASVKVAVKAKAKVKVVKVKKEKVEEVKKEEPAAGGKKGGKEAAPKAAAAKADAKAAPKGAGKAAPKAAAKADGKAAPKAAAKGGKKK